MIDLKHRNAHLLQHFHDFRRVLHIAIRQLANVHQAVLVHTHVDERSEGGDVGDNSR